MSGPPWVRFFPSDWLAGTRGLSAIESGVYITLVALMYERGGPLTENRGRLARVCGTSNKRFEMALSALIGHGKIIETDLGLWNDRVEKESELRSEKTKTAALAGRASGRSRSANADPSPGVKSQNENVKRRSGFSSACSENRKPQQKQRAAGTDVQRTFNGRSTDVELTRYRSKKVSKIPEQKEVGYLLRARERARETLSQILNLKTAINHAPKPWGLAVAHHFPDN